MITVFSEGSNQAGSMYILKCTIILPTGVTVSDEPSVEWRRPSGGSTTGNIISSAGGVSGDISVYLSQLTLDPLTLYDGGDYTCIATYSLEGQTSPSVTGTFSFSVVCKCRNSYNIMIIIIC